MKKLIAILIVSILSTTLLGCDKIFGASKSFNITPNFTNLTIEDATSLANKNNLKLEFVYDDYNKNYSDKVVIGQSISEGVVVANNTKIILTINNYVYKYLVFSYIDDKTTLDKVVTNGGSVINPTDPTYHRLKKGTLMLSGLNLDDDLTSLNIPETYKGIPITAIDHYLLANSQISHLAIPSTITVIGINLCGTRDGVDENSKISTIVFLSDTPIFIGSLALTEAQLNGSCKIYVPDVAVEAYKNYDEGFFPLSTYKDLILPLSQLPIEDKNILGL